MKRLFYARVSSNSQKTDRQIETFKKMEGFSRSNLYSDICSGAEYFMQREEALKLWDFATSSEDSITIVVESIDRLGRNFRDILDTVERFTNSEVCIEFIKEGFKTLNEYGKVNQYGKIILAVMGSIAEAERERIRERQMEGIANAKAKGVYSDNGKKRKGFKETPDAFLKKHNDVVLKLKQGLSYRDIAKVTGKSTSTIAKVVKAID
jgi:DNA invertase Pin-like site-specific DNA recombinase